jgi:predicted DNA-binding WGR domain protein
MAAKVKTSSSQSLREGNYTVSKVTELNFFDLTGEKAGTRGSSSKQYRIELWVSKSSPQQSELFSEYGATGNTNLSKDYRFFDTDLAAAEKEYDKIVASKKKKGYVEIDVAQRAFGSEEAKKITKAVTLKNAETLTANIRKSSLHLETQRLISSLMGATNQFVIQTLKCPLGQLTNAQIDLGRDILALAKNIINVPNPSSDQILSVTNQFYATIPHNLGSGYRGQMTELLIDNPNKIATLEDELDTLEDAKSIGATVSTGSNIDDQYNSLDTDFTYLEHSSDLFKWINRMLQETRASNHYGYGKFRLLNVWAVNRHNERQTFLKNVEVLSKLSSNISLPKAIKDLVPLRPDFDSSCQNYIKSNTWPLFHGTRSQNVTGILKKGYLIRPAGVVLCGSMYGEGTYFASQASKSIGYCSLSNSIWSRGNEKIGYLFLNDVIMGNPLMVSHSGNYNEQNVSPKNSVWAVGGKSGVINDEMIVYNTKQANQRYLLEFDCV